MAERNGVDLASGDQAAQNFTDLAACCERGQEHLHFFHACGDDCLQVDRSKHGDGGDLRSGRALSNRLLEARAEELPFGSGAGSRDDRDDAKLLPKLGDGAQNSAFCDFAAQGVLERRDGCIACFKQFVGLDGELRNLARAGKLRAAGPVAIAAKGVHVGQNPSGHNKVRLFAGLSQQVEAHGYAVCLQANQ